MGDRSAIQFRNQYQETGDGYEVEYSCILYDHWGGVKLVRKAETYADELTKWVKSLGDSSDLYPLARFEVDVVMLDFLREYLAEWADIFKNQAGHERIMSGSRIWGLRDQDEVNDELNHGLAIIDLPWKPEYRLEYDD